MYIPEKTSTWRMIDVQEKKRKKTEKERKELKMTT
jgi:hypothetical protein